MLAPDEEPRCECRYNRARDAMDRDDCAFHCDLIEESAAEEPSSRQRKRADAWAGPEKAIQKDDAA
jgi:hypothetical protein